MHALEEMLRPLLRWTPPPRGPSERPDLTLKRRAAATALDMIQSLRKALADDSSRGGRESVERHRSQCLRAVAELQKICESYDHICAQYPAPAARRT